MAEKSEIIRKLIFAAAGAVLLFFAGSEFYSHRNMKEQVVLGEGVTGVKKLGDYFEGIRGTINDCNIYIMEGKEPGATMFVMGAAHPEEPAGRLAPWIMVENGIMEKGRLILVLSGNRSGSTVTRVSGGYPTDFTIPTGWGGQKFRMGDRWSNPLDQWPDPEVYIHYPSGQNLAYVDIRNLNRCWPGRPHGTLTERTCYAFMELIKQENVDLFIDLHEAELQYPVISTIVAHDRGQELGMYVSMMLTDWEEFNMGMEFSPKELHGLSHREVGDHSEAVSLLFEAPQPFLDATRGRTTREQLLTGKDEFVVMAGEHGLLYEKIDENGWHINVRVGRHTSAVLQTMESWTELNPDKPLSIIHVPKYAEVIENGIGFYLKDPKKADPAKVIIE